MSASKDGLIKQFASGLLGFSSQYGAERSVSYVLKNIIGEPSQYPSYGDYSDVAVFRTYGPWWKVGPDSLQSISTTHNSRFFQSDDYVELLFDSKVYITAVNVYETYNPGAVVRILTLDDDAVKSSEKWFILWEAKKYPPPLLQKESRIFSPKLKKPPFPSQTVRIEFAHDKLEYYTEIDAVEIEGRTDVSVDVLNYQQEQTTPDITSLTLSNVDKSCHIGQLPDELLHKVLCYLCLDDLGRLACVSRKFCSLCSDGHIMSFQHLNLKPYWFLITDNSLVGFGKKCSMLKSLYMSWCGSQDVVSDAGFLEFINRTGENLLTLHLASCSFLSDALLKKVLKTCTRLTDLSLASTLASVTSASLQAISFLSQLQRLNLYRSAIDIYGIVSICRMCPDLEYINLASCIMIEDYDEAVKAIATNCKHIKGLDLWRTDSLSQSGILTLAEQSKSLECLDIGWCKGIQRQNNEISCISVLVESCPNFRKLILTANRMIADRDLHAIAKYSHKLEQLDILGSNAVTFEGVEMVLKHCKKLTFFDISFCAHIDFQRWNRLQDVYKQCAIKKSFQ